VPVVDRQGREAARQLPFFLAIEPWPNKREVRSVSAWLAGEKVAGLMVVWPARQLLDRPTEGGGWERGWCWADASGPRPKRRNGRHR